MVKNRKSLISVSRREICQSVQPTNERNELPIELTNNLQQMNEDCLLEIFSMNSLELMDLCSLAETCRRFRKITQRIAPKKLQIRHLASVGYVVGNMEKTRADVERIFKNFGSIFTEVSLNNESYIKNLGSIISIISEVCLNKGLLILDLVARYCEDTDNLKSLMIDTINIFYAPTVKLKPIFKRLQKLHLAKVNGMGNTTLFAELDSLVELIMDRTDNCNAILDNSFPKLERFTTHIKQTIVMADTISDPGNEQSLETLCSFISIHKTLKTLNLTISACDDSCRKIILQEIGNNCKYLNELSIDIGNKTAASLWPLQTLKSLRTLQLHKMSLKDFNFFSVLTELRELCLVHCYLLEDSVEFASEFASLAQLTKLKLEDCYTHGAFDVVGMVERLVNLKGLSIQNLATESINFALDEKTLSKIVGTVKGRRIVLALKCKFNFKVNTICRNLILLAEN